MYMLVPDSVSSCSKSQAFIVWSKSPAMLNESDVNLGRAARLPRLLESSLLKPLN